MFKRLAFACAAALAVVLGAPGTAQAAPPPAESFVQRDAGLVAVSPSGNYVAMMVATGPGTSALMIAPFTGGQLGQARQSSVGDKQVVGLAFKSDDLILLTVLQENVRLTGVRFDDPESATITRAVVLAVPRAGGEPIMLKPTKAQSVTVKEVLPNDPDHVILEGYEGRITENYLYRVASLYRINVRTGESEVIGSPIAREIGTSRNHTFVATTGWEVDHNGEPYVRYDSEPHNGVMTVMTRPQGGDWVRFARYATIEEAPRLTFIGRASAGTAYAIDRAGQDKRAVWEYDLATARPLRQVMADPNGEAYDAVYDDARGQLLGAAFMVRGMPRYSYAAKQLTAAQAALTESFPEFPINRIVGVSSDYGVYAVVSEGPAVAPVTTLFDARNMAAIGLAAVYPLDPGVMSPVSTITYASSDGATITAYVTVPRSGGKGAPVVVMPHGGPEYADTLTFETWRQFLASRGYVVLQPQFRGSDGFGAAFERAGHLAWGTLVQDDVRAGLAALGAKGIGDVSRTCIFGWSYGGYMALAGATMSPGLYKCAISGAGPSDLDAMMSWTINRYGSGEQQQYWLQRMGDETARAAASPARYAAQAQIPILLIHGEKDNVVPVEQSEIMEKALTAAGKTVTFKRVAGEGHSFYGAAEADMLRTVEAFLAQNLR